MNRICLAWPLSAVLLTLSCVTGCSMFAPRAGPTQEAERIGVYEATPPGNRNYRKVVRLMVEPRSSALSVPRYSSVEAGAADLRNYAIAYGGDAVVNFGCYHIDRNPLSALICNGTVIRYDQ